VLTRPSSIAVHDDGDVEGNLGRSGVFNHAGRSGHGQLPRKLGQGEHPPDL